VDETPTSTEKKNKKKNRDETGDAEPVDETPTSREKKKKKKSPDETGDAHEPEVVEPAPKKTTPGGETRKNEAKAKAAPASNSKVNDAEDVGEYPESPRERFEKKSASASPHQASATCKETGKQKKLEELQHVIRTPRMFSYQETGTQHVPMQQLQIGDFWQDGSVKAKEKGKAKARAKNTTKR
jgi:hypothetical protein